MTSILFVASIAFFIFCLTAGISWAWKIGWKWGRWEAEKKWKRERGIK